MAKSKSYNKKSSLNIEWYALPIAAALVVISLAVRIALSQNTRDVVSLLATTQTVSLFTTIKFQLLLFFAGVMVIALAAAFKRFLPPKDSSLKIYFIAVGVFGVFTFLSASFSDNIQLAFSGFPDQHEGFMTILGYIVLFVYTLLVYLKVNNHKFIIYPLMIVVAANTLICTLEMAGIIFFDLEWVRKLIIPTQFWSQLLDAQSDLVAGSGTFANSNYLAAFAAMVMPLFSSLALTEKKLSYRIIYGIWAVLSLMLLFFSRASSGIAGLAVMVLVALFVFRSELVKHWKISIAIVVLGVVSVFSVNALTGNSLSDSIKPIVSGAVSIFSPKEDTTPDDLRINDITIDGHSLILDGVSDVVTLTMRNNEYVFTDSSGTEHQPTVSPTERGSRFRFSEPHMEPFMFDLDKTSDDLEYDNILSFYYRGKLVAIFGYDDDGFYMRNPFTLGRQEMQNAEVWLLDGLEDIGTGRGFIWGRSLPLIPENLFLGAGPDNFVFEFPQFDPVDQANYKTITTLTTKPHNMYLQMLINNGGVAFVAFMTMIVLYFRDCFRLYAGKTRDLHKSGMGIAVMLSTVAYLMAGMFNDSIVYVSPAFWILFGLGIAINYKNKTAQ